MAKESRKNRRKSDLSEEKAAELREIARQRIGLRPASGTADGSADGGTREDGRTGPEERAPRAEER